MNADYGAPTELAGPLQQRRALYQPRLPPCLQVIIDHPPTPPPHRFLGISVANLRLKKLDIT
jgi:hypothetical protein